MDQMDQFLRILTATGIATICIFALAHFVGYLRIRKPVGEIILMFALPVFLAISFRVVAPSEFFEIYHDLLILLT